MQCGEVEERYYRRDYERCGLGMESYLLDCFVGQENDHNVDCPWHDEENESGWVTDVIVANDHQAEERLQNRDCGHGDRVCEGAAVGALEEKVDQDGIRNVVEDERRKKNQDPVMGSELVGRVQKVSWLANQARALTRICAPRARTSRSMALRLSGDRRRGRCGVLESGLGTGASLADAAAISGTGERAMPRPSHTINHTPRITTPAAPAKYGTTCSGCLVPPNPPWDAHIDSSTSRRLRIRTNPDVRMMPSVRSVLAAQRSMNVGHGNGRDEVGEVDLGRRGRS